MSEQKDRWTLLAETARELNKVLGLEPEIPTSDVSEAELEKKLEEAADLVAPEDEFTDQTAYILSEFTNIVEVPEGYEAEEVEAESESEENDGETVVTEETEAEEAEEEEYTLEEIREFVETTAKRKDLRIFAEEFPDVFEDSIDKMNEGGLRDAKALRESMLSDLDAEEEVEEDWDEEETEEVEVDEKENTEPEPEEEKPEKKDKPKKKMGVIATIASSIEEAGKEGISKEEILDILDEKFPNRARSSMKNTIGVQVPTRISKEKFEVEKTEDGKYRKA